MYGRQMGLRMFCRWALGMPIIGKGATDVRNCDTCVSVQGEVACHAL